MNVAIEYHWWLYQRSKQVVVCDDLLLLWRSNGIKKKVLPCVYFFLLCFGPEWKKERKGQKKK